MKYTFYYYMDDKLIYAGNCVDVNKVKERHLNEYNLGYAQNGYDACFYKYLKDNKIKYGDLRFESKEAIINTSEEVIAEENPICNKKIPICSISCTNDCYIYSYIYNSELLYMKSSFDVDADHKKHIDNFEKEKNTIYFYVYMKSKGITFDDLILSYERVKVLNINELNDLEDKMVMENLPLCNTSLNCIRSKKDIFKELHEDMLNDDKDDKIIKFKLNMIKKLIKQF